jgi:hypothetical protein
MPIRKKDELISQQSIQEIHHEFAARTNTEINNLAEREPALVAYVICTGHFLTSTAEVAGAQKSFRRWLHQEVVLRMMVALEAQRKAQYELWRDLMGDQVESTDSDTTKTPEEPKPKLSALALAKRRNHYAMVSWTPTDVRQIRPAWTDSEARKFLQKYQLKFVNILVELGRLKLGMLIDEYERELRHE